MVAGSGFLTKAWEGLWLFLVSVSDWGMPWISREWTPDPLHSIGNMAPHHSHSVWSTPCPSISRVFPLAPLLFWIIFRRLEKSHFPPHIWTLLELGCIFQVMKNGHGVGHHILSRTHSDSSVTAAGAGGWHHHLKVSVQRLLKGTWQTGF